MNITKDQLPSLVGKKVKYISKNLNNSYTSEYGKVVFVDQTDNTVLMEHPQGFRPTKSEIKRFNCIKEKTYIYADIKDITINK